MERLGGDTCLNDGWRLFGERRGLLMAVGLLVWCIEGIFFVPIALYDPRVGPALWLALVASLVLVVPLHVGLQSLALAVARGRPCSFATAFIGFPRFGRLMGISFVTALRLLVALLPLGGALALWSFVGTRSAVWLFVIGVLGGGISLVLGGRVAMRYRYAGILALEDGTGVLDSIRASAELTRGSRLTLYGIERWPNVMSAPAFIALVHFHSVWIGYGLLLIYAVVGYPWRVTSGMVAYRTLREGREEAPVWSAS